MTVISAVQCNDCGRRVFLAEAEAEEWTTSQVTTPSTRRREMRHYCPRCAAAQDERNNNFHTENLTTNQHRVVNPDQIDPELEKLMSPAAEDPHHEREDALAGVPITARAQTPPGGTNLPTFDNWQPALPPVAPATPAVRSTSRRKRVRARSGTATVTSTLVAFVLFLAAKTW